MPPPLGPLSLRSGGRSRGRWPLPSVGAFAVCAGAALRAALNGGPGRLPRPGGSLRSPRGPRLRPLRRLRPGPRLARPRPSLGGRVPPRARRCGGSGGGGAPPVGGLLRRPRVAGALVGLRCGRAPWRSPSLRCALPACAPAPPRGPPSGPAAARRLRAARLPSLLPPRGRPGGGARKDRAPLGGVAARASWPAAWVGCSAARWWSGRGAADGVRITFSCHIFREKRDNLGGLRRCGCAAGQESKLLAAHARSLGASTPETQQHATAALRGGGHSGPL